MKKTIAILSALTLLTTSAASTAAAVETEISASISTSTEETADPDAAEIDIELPTVYEYNEIYELGKYFVVCRAVPNDAELELKQTGRGTVKQVKKYEISPEHPDPEDGEKYKVWVYEAQSEGCIEIKMNLKDENGYIGGIGSRQYYVDQDNVFRTYNSVAKGDANCDGKVTLADAAAVLQYLGNADKYPLSAEAKVFADVYKMDPGITTHDAIYIQKYVLGLESDLPVYAYVSPETTTECPGMFGG